jgi:hypothetical protein
MKPMISIASMRHATAMGVQRRIDEVFASFAGDVAPGDESRA